LTFVFCRWTLESLGALEPRQSALEEDFEEEEENEDNEQPADEPEKVLSFLKQSTFPLFFLYECDSDVLV